MENAWSIRNKIFEVYDYIQRSELDILLLNETCLNSKIKLTRNPHYIIYRLDRFDKTKKFKKLKITRFKMNKI